MHELLCVKEQIGICGSVLDEAVGYHAYSARAQWLTENGTRVRRAFETVRDWIAREPMLEWIEPAGGCVCFPRIRADAGIDTDRFYRVLNDEYGTYVGPGHWFEQSDRSFRLGYGWPLPEELDYGLDSISRALRA
jgi:aspartate/methionine/tyrosine aminotransferase